VLWQSCCYSSRTLKGIRGETEGQLGEGLQRGTRAGVERRGLCQIVGGPNQGGFTAGGPPTLQRSTRGKNGQFWKVAIVSASVRVIKRGRIEVSRDIEDDDNSKRSSRQLTREIVNTVKGWVAEVEQRRRGATRRRQSL